MYPNRLVALATAVLGVAAAISVPLANLDWSSTVGVIAGIGAAAAAAVKWLDGWQQHEGRLAYPAAPAVVPDDDQGDAGFASVTAPPPVKPTKAKR